MERPLTFELSDFYQQAVNASAEDRVVLANPSKYNPSSIKIIKHHNKGLLWTLGYSSSPSWVKGIGQLNQATQALNRKTRQHLKAALLSNFPEAEESINNLLPEHTLSNKLSAGQARMYIERISHLTQ